jgi:ubiquinone/menaquinone biosynthesis C-methylase UbiE
MCAERAHPEDPAFQDRWIWRRRLKGLLPWPMFVRSPWRKAFFERYRFCHSYAIGKRVLDVPCGVGWGTSLLERTTLLTGLDLSEDAIRYAKEHYGDRADFHTADMRKLPFVDASFDLVICLEGIEHVPVEVGAQFVREAARVLTDGGRLILTNPLPDSSRPPNSYHLHEYTQEGLEKLLEPCFRTERREVHEISGVSLIHYVGIVRRAEPTR